jgi:hypothetical protein
MPDQPDTIATPEGDNEAGPGDPLVPPTADGLEIPPGNAPNAYDSDKKPEHKPEGIEKFIDEVVRGEYM